MGSRECNTLMALSISLEGLAEEAVILGLRGEVEVARPRDANLLTARKRRGFNPRPAWRSWPLTSSVCAARACACGLTRCLLHCLVQA